MLTDDSISDCVSLLTPSLATTNPTALTNNGNTKKPTATSGAATDKDTNGSNRPRASKYRGVYRCGKKWKSQVHKPTTLSYSCWTVIMYVIV
jgi:hypothetical protein